MTTNSNIYAFARIAAMREFSERVEGNPSGIVLVVYTEPLGEAAKNALEKSFDAIGFGKAACTFADVRDLPPDDVFTLVESLDPLALVAADGTAAQACADAARQPFPLQRKARFFGREARAFNHLNAMFETDADKQAVWHLLKTMAQ